MHRHYPNTTQSIWQRWLAQLAALAGIPAALLGAIVGMEELGLLHWREKSVEPPTIVAFQSSPPYVHPGENVSLQWKVKNAGRCNITWMQDSGRRESRSVESEGQLHVRVPYSAGEVEYVLDCHNGRKDDTEKTVVHVKDPKPPGQERYAAAKDIMKYLDCNSKRKEGQRQFFFTNSLNGRRTIIPALIREVDDETNLAYLGLGPVSGLGTRWDGSPGQVTIEFDVPPSVEFREFSEFAKITSGATVSLDCRIAGYCRQGMIWLVGGRGIEFDDCRLL